jgi:DNA mismatch repair protein MutL
MKRIKQLPKNLINQIAAGEVIERPASVVKELVENSIDAGASRIEVEISNGGRDIRVADNGSGIHKDDVVLAFSRHATSKIEEQNDLWKINTLGFRGEALASIISVAKVTCTTRTAENQTGYKVECCDSEVNLTETGCATGTTMDVKDLFYNVPVRLKFLKNPQSEVAAISELLQNIAISHPEVALNLIHKKASVFKTTGSDDLAATISEIYSNDIINDLSEVYFEDQTFNLKISGFVSNPDYYRSNRKAVYVFVNGRTVKCPIILKAIDTAYKDMIPQGKYPFAVLNLTMPSDEVDVNVHPTKKEVKYTKPNLIFNFVYSATKNALEKNPRFSGYKLAEEGISFTSPFYSPEHSCHPELDSGSIHSSHINKELSEQIPNQVRNDSNRIIDFSKFAQLHEQEDIIEIPAPQLPVTKEIYQNKIEFVAEKEETPVNYKIIGQFDNTYILIETDEGLEVIDQHIAHERHLYEQLKSSRTVASQILLTSPLIEPDFENAMLLQENADILEKYGFEFDFIPQNTGIAVKFKKIPQLLANKNPENILNELIDAVQASAEEIDNEILEKIACHAAVKAGEKLSVWQMEELIKIWANTKFNRTCPHGRKIAHLLPTKEIARFFGRNN